MTTAVLPPQIPYTLDTLRPGYLPLTPSTAQKTPGTRDTLPHGKDLVLEIPYPMERTWY